MTVKLHPSWVEALARVPETGMGYQVLELRDLSLRPQHVIVVNAREAVEVARGRLAVSEAMDRAVADRIVKTLTSSITEASFRVLSRGEAVRARVVESRARHLLSRPNPMNGFSVTRRTATTSGF